MSEVLATIAAVAAVGGALFFVASAIGLLRFPDFYTRLHAPTKAATLGVLLIVVSTLLLNERPPAMWIEDGLLVVFLMLTMPVSAQMLARAALKRGEAGDASRGKGPS
ncbi:MAG: monovalent cation/H(+) antiporter subunit G [Myxococcota bacterium]